MIEIVKQSGFRVDFLPSSRPNGRLVYTYTGLHNRELAGDGFGGDFLAKHGFDVVVVKTERDNWYQDFVPTALEKIYQFLASRPPYEHVATYGSSMGGYAEMRFARLLAANSVLAISPQFSIVSDPRWSDHLKKIGPFHEPQSSDMCDRCKYVIASDPEDDDGKHTEAYSVIAKNMERIDLPFIGHPVGLFLQNSGILKEIAISVLSYGSVPPGLRKIYLAHRKKDEKYLFCVGRRLAETNKVKSALLAFERARTANPLHPEYSANIAALHQKMGNTMKALEHAALAVALNPNHPDMLASLALILYKLGRRAEAVEHMIRAATLNNSPTMQAYLREMVVGLEHSK